MSGSPAHAEQMPEPLRRRMDDVCEELTPHLRAQLAELGVPDPERYELAWGDDA